MSRKRAHAPHCDSAILHAPGECEFCDEYPDWQEYRRIARIAFTNEDTTEHRSPCPSEWFRSPSVRDLWGGNQAKPMEYRLQVTNPDGIDVAKAVERELRRIQHPSEDEKFQPKRWWGWKK